MPMVPTQSVTGRGPDKPIIRIKSGHKLPERIVFDTSAPTIVPQTAPVVADAPVTNPPREAFAMMGAQVPAVSKTPLPVRTERKVTKRAPHTWRAAYRPSCKSRSVTRWLVIR